MIANEFTKDKNITNIVEIVSQFQQVEKFNGK